MRRICCITSGVSVACLMLVGCQRANNAPAPRAAAPQAGALAAENLTIGEPIRHGNLTIFPVTAKIARHDDRFITLDEGVAARTVEVFEMGAYPPAAAPAADDAQQIPAPAQGQTRAVAAAAPQPTQAAQQAQPAEGATQPQQAANPPADNPASDDPFANSNQEQASPDVNRVLVLNKSSQPLYLMPGETILGGQQDRTIAEETIVPPGDKPVEVAVFCVEHGRWHDRSPQETARLATAARAGEEGYVDFASQTSLIASTISPNRFIAGSGNLSKEARLAVQADKDQSKVWEKVSKANSAAHLIVETGAFSANYGDEENLKRLEPYQKALAEQVAADDRVVGVIVAINGRVESVDVFESTPLFRKLWPKLLRSYALDAANQADEERRRQAGRAGRRASVFRPDDERPGGRNQSRGWFAANQSPVEGSRELSFWWSARDRRRC